MIVSALIIVGWLLGSALGLAWVSWDGLTPRKRRELEARWTESAAAASRSWQ